MFVAYADCGTGGGLDALLREFPACSGCRARTATRCSPGAEQFAALHDAELGTFYLTDFLAKHFDALVWSGLGLDRHPELRDLYFGAYTAGRVALAGTRRRAGRAGARRGGPARARLRAAADRSRRARVRCSRTSIAKQADAAAR